MPSSLNWLTGASRKTLLSLPLPNARSASGISSAKTHCPNPPPGGEVGQRSVAGRRRLLRPCRPADLRRGHRGYISAARAARQAASTTTCVGPARCSRTPVTARRGPVGPPRPAACKVPPSSTGFPQP
jgi:hypothetical protein